MHGAGIGEGFLLIRSVAIANHVYTADPLSVLEPGAVRRQHPHLVAEGLLALGQREQESPGHVIDMPGEVVGDEEDFQRETPTPRRERRVIRRRALAKGRQS